MFNPFYPFTRQLLEAFVRRGKRYFVRQTFTRGMNLLEQPGRMCFLFSHYDNLTTALDHFGAISYDPNRFLYHWDNPDHRGRLGVAASQLPGYQVYATVFRPGWERQVTERMQEQLRLYIKQLGWAPRRVEGVRTNYELQFGELYIRIRHGVREAKIKFEEIEKLS